MMLSQHLFTRHWQRLTLGLYHMLPMRTITSGSRRGSLLHSKHMHHLRLPHQAALDIGCLSCSQPLLPAQAGHTVASERASHAAWS